LAHTKFDWISLLCWIWGLSEMVTSFAEFDICNSKKKWWYYWGRSLYCSLLEILHLLFSVEVWLNIVLSFWTLLFLLFLIWLVQFQLICFKFLEVFGITSFQLDFLSFWFLISSPNLLRFWISPIEVELSIIWNEFVSSCGVVVVSSFPVN